MSTPNQSAAAITNAFRTQGKVAEKDQVSTSVVGTTQSVVVTASAENHEKIKALLAELDVDTSAVARQNHLIKLQEGEFG